MPFNMEFISGKKKYTLQGLSQEALIYLALRGGRDYLKRKADQDEAWKRLTSGELFNKEKEFPLIIHAIARAGGVTPEEASRQWRDLSRPDQAALRQDTSVRRAYYELKLLSLDT